jgi:cell division protein FtsZ
VRQANVALAANIAALLAEIARLPRPLVAIDILSFSACRRNREAKMTSITDIREMMARIIVLGVGGAGGDAVNNMIASGLQGVEFIVANTDAQALTMSRAKRIIQMGAQVTQGLGAGSQPEVGCAAAEEATNALTAHLTGAHMVFITADMGGGTGTGAAPVNSQDRV